MFWLLFEKHLNKIGKGYRETILFVHITSKGLKGQPGKIFTKPEPPVETKEYACAVCKLDNFRFKPLGHARYMKSSHKFHEGFDLKLPERTDRKGFILGTLIVLEAFEIELKQKMSCGSEFSSKL